MLIHIGTGSLHLRIFGNRLLKMELPVSGLGLLFQLGHLLERLVCTAPVSYTHLGRGGKGNSGLCDPLRSVGPDDGTAHYAVVYRCV